MTEDNEEPGLPPRAQQASILLGVADRYRSPVPYQPGDLLQPRNHREDLVAEPRDPWVVLEVAPDAPLAPDGTRNNMRIATLMQKGLYVTWTEHWGWERYQDGTPGQSTLQ